MNKLQKNKKKRIMFIKFGDVIKRWRRNNKMLRI